ncbi:hypothetical protein [Actinomycetospora sp. TBRC 11914]|uniref:hypothetical protein n=1 Tax=Actinomycetospora sp. TBRC 11914 TaxID=2729387 RepID=UPI00145F89DD|nr:hypothetical protein [Actinomycetospora sp. TBRC 11914]NMO91580.1 hypothetical protein [Actinomycetospora sp. TBRC 11914]
MEQRLALSSHRLCLLAGPTMTVLFLVGWFACLKWIPAPSPMMTPDAVAAMFVEHRVSFQLGFVCMIIAAALMGPWAVSMAMWTRKTEARFPVLTYTQLVAVAASVCIFVIVYIPWGVAAFDAGSLPAPIIQALNHLGWFFFLFDVAPFSVWLAALGVGILWNPGEHRLLPRWAGWYTLVESFAIAPAIMILFFKNGPFAYNGFLALWWPFGTFFVWVVLMTVLTWKALNAQVRLDEANGVQVYRAQIDEDEVPADDGSTDLDHVRPVPAAI